jgi:hypothetical protein
MTADLIPVPRYRYRWWVTFTCGHSRAWCTTGAPPAGAKGLCTECPPRTLGTVIAAHDLWGLT